MRIVSKLNLRCLILPSLGAAMLSCAGCADAYRRSADADVYRLLNDRKMRALAYNPQAFSEPLAGPAGKSHAVDAPDIRPGSRVTDATLASQHGAEPADPREGPVSRRAYDRIPVTAIAPSAPPVLELPPPIAPAVPLGPYREDLLQVDPARADPFAADMAARWLDHRNVFGPTPPRKQPIQLDLFASLSYGTLHSRRYRAQMDELYLAALDVTLQRHLLSPRPFARTGLQYTGGQATTAYNSALTATLDAGVRQKLPYGGEIVAETLVNFVHALDGAATDGESASVVLSGSIPLLRGAGMVNLEGLISSEREVVYQVRAFEEFRRQFAIDVANAYFRLLASYQAVNNRRANVNNSISLLERTRAIYAANVGAGGQVGRLRLTYLEVQRSEQQLLDAQNSLIDSQESYLNELDNFKLLLGMDIREEVDIIPVALDLKMPDLEHRDVIAVANQFRLDLQTARDRIDDARRNVSNAANGLLPDLSLTGLAQAGNPADAPAKSLNSRTLTYAAGITLDLPVDRLPERNVYRRALIGLYQSQRSFDDLQDRISAEVRASVRAIRSSEVSVAIQKRSIELAERRLENSNLLLKRGETNARDVVEAQDALIRSQDAYERARADLQVQVLQFLDRTGTLRVDPESGSLGKALDRAANSRDLSRQRAGANGSPGPG
jgi:outer membrane protein TolC